MALECRSDVIEGLQRSLVNWKVEQHAVSHDLEQRQIGIRQFETAWNVDDDRRHALFAIVTAGGLHRQLLAVLEQQERKSSQELRLTIPRGAVMFPVFLVFDCASG